MGGHMLSTPPPSVCLYFPLSELSFWALRKTVFRRDAGVLDMEILTYIQVWEKMAELELCQG